MPGKNERADEARKKKDTWSEADTAERLDEKEPDRREEKKETKRADKRAEKREEKCEERHEHHEHHERHEHKKAPKEKKPKRSPLSPDCAFHQVMPIILVALAAFVGICIYTSTSVGVLGDFIRNVCFGLLGPSAYSIPIFCLIAAIRWHSMAKSRVLMLSGVFTAVCILLISVMCYTFGMPEVETAAVSRYYDLGLSGIGGGLLGGLLGYALNFLVSKTGTVILAILLLCLFLVFAFGLRPRAVMSALAKFFAERLRTRRERRQRVREEREEQKAMRQSEQAAEQALTPIVQKPTPTREVARRAVVRRLYDADADDARTGEEDLEDVAVQQPTSRPVIKAERRFFDDDALFSDDIPSSRDTYTIIHGNSKPSPVPTPVPDDEEIAASIEESRMPHVEIVSDDPIPENNAHPFAAREAEDVSDVLVEVEDTDILSVTAEDAESTDEGEAEHSTDEDAADKTLVINKAHVIEHIGADKLAEDKEQTKKDPFFYSFPPLSLLQEDKEANREDSDQEIAIKAKKLRETLESYGVRAEITCVSRGPRLTRYELVPDNGVRIRAIENLVDEITMNLEAVSVRIEAPIPGKAAIGVEVPNVHTAAVRLRGLLDTDTFRDAPGKTTVCLGVDVVGVPVFADLDKMPHLLVAGATGMGKSVCINSILISLLYKARPDEVKLILIDPKKVEFQSYCNIPHLLVPVVTDPQKAAGALSWAVNEMERRYDLIETAGVRNIASYNKTVADHPGRSFLPQIVVVIDELHDLMLQARDAVEDSIARIAAKARAAGILLIIGTQRPSVNVITGVIKANIPSRIAFHVASQVDSRTILDVTGAEKLLNNGDMLFLSPGMKMMTPKRVQGAFLDDDEVNRVADYLRKNSSRVEYDEAIMADMDRESEKYNKDKKQGGDFGSDGGDFGGGEDDLFYRAVEVALESGEISTSLLQRRLSLGFGKAARMIDRMQDMGIVGPKNGQKAREVLITADEYRQMRLRSDE